MAPSSTTSRRTVRPRSRLQDITRYIIDSSTQEAYDDDVLYWLAQQLDSEPDKDAACLPLSPYGDGDASQEDFEYQRSQTWTYNQSMLNYSNGDTVDQAPLYGTQDLSDISDVSRVNSEDGHGHASAEDTDRGAQYLHARNQEPNHTTERQYAISYSCNTPTTEEDISECESEDSEKDAIDYDDSPEDEDAGRFSDEDADNTQDPEETFEYGSYGSSGSTYSYQPVAPAAANDQVADQDDQQWILPPQQQAAPPQQYEGNRPLTIYPRRGCMLELHDEDAVAADIALAHKPLFLQSQWRFIRDALLLHSVRPRHAPVQSPLKRKTREWEDPERPRKRARQN